MSTTHHTVRVATAALADQRSLEPAVRPCVVALLHRREDVRRLQAAMGRTMELRAVRVVSALYELAIVQDHPLIAVLVESMDSEGTPAAFVVQRIHAQRPEVPVIGYCRPGNAKGTATVEFARIGVHEILFGGIDDTREAFTSVIRRAMHAVVGAEILRVLRKHISSEAEPIVAYCIANARRGLTSRQMARGLGVGTSTLRRRCVTFDLPNPNALITWIRLMIAAHLHEQEGASVDGVASALDFRSPRSLRNTFERYTGLRPTEVRERGGLACVIEKFCAPEARGRV